ncbi:MAG: tryptophan--tRNA ligase [candidate division WWE3 bacterium]|nr:tryptophan--tRNA ligase [candidate division WWE3 bacterium]
MKKRILTGDRPTGHLHLGHYVGSLANRLKLQDEYEEFIIVADVQALTDNFEHPEKIRANILEVTMDHLAIGIDPSKTTFFIQSLIPQIAELTVFYANLVSVNQLGHNPTVKTELKDKGMEESVPLGFFMYPVSQAADITSVNASLVPVGSDQLPHIEQTREIVRKFNQIYKPVLNEPEALVGDVARLPGIDGKSKMSKSLGNCIYLSESTATLRNKVKSMYTDPTRIRATDPGHLEGNMVFTYLDVFDADKNLVADLKLQYQAGKVGDVAVKERLFNVLEEFIAPIRERRSYFEAHPEEVKEILMSGTKKAERVAAETLALVKFAMGIDY